MVICFIALCLIICGIFLNSIFTYIKRIMYIRNFKEYISVLTYHMEKSYDMLHKDKILAYSLDAYRIPDEEYEKISHDFVKLVQKYLGPNFLKEYVELYGNEAAFIFNLLDYFSSRYENDEIRKTSMDNLTKEE